jgi:hypothetical protein
MEFGAWKELSIIPKDSVIVYSYAQYFISVCCCSELELELQAGMLTGPCRMDLVREQVHKILRRS